MGHKGNGLRYVNVSIPTKSVRTVSDTNGAFVLTMPPAGQDDTLYFSMPGYATFKVPLATLGNTGRQIFTLDARPTMLETVTVSRGRLEKRALERGAGALSGNHG